MENFITRTVATLCAAGSVALFWTFGIFFAVPWREGRMLALNAVEVQVVGIPLIVGLLVYWGAIHILAIADREANPRFYKAVKITLAIAALAAVIGGISWSQARIA